MKSKIQFLQWQQSHFKGSVAMSDTEVLRRTEKPGDSCTQGEAELVSMSCWSGARLEDSVSAILIGFGVWSVTEISSLRNTYLAWIHSNSGMNNSNGIHNGNNTYLI